MSTMIFDTHAFIKKLTMAGMPEKQAGVLASTQAALLEEHIATKSDLRELEYRLTIRLGTMMVVAVGMVATLVKLL